MSPRNSRTSLSIKDYEALASFRYAMRKFLRFSKEFLAATADLTPEQYEALLALKAFGSAEGLIVGELSERLQVKHHTAVALTDKLVSRKLVTKKRKKLDQRMVHVKLTTAGQTLLASVAVIHFDRLRGHVSEIFRALKHLGKSSDARNSK
jgi:DNA-binding MarR family transcriptional regulator